MCKGSEKYIHAYREREFKAKNLSINDKYMNTEIEKTLR